MAISGKFEADFGGFVGEVERSVVSLDKLDSKSINIGTSLTRMVDGFSGRKVIADAILMAEAVDRVGGAALLTESELRQVGITASEATAKLNAMGVEVPPKVQRIADAYKAVGGSAATSAPQVTQLHSALNSFDSVLAAMGLHIGPDIRGITELGSASGQTFSELGAVATAGLAVGAAIGGWKIGRAAADFFDLDVKIGNATAKLLGWGDVAAEVAGSKADILARASAAIGTEVHNLSDAIAINIAAHHDWRANVTISAAAVAGWRAELKKVGADLPSLTKDLESQNFTLKDLAARYHVSVEALQFFTRETKAAGDAEQAASEIIKASNATKLHALAAELEARKALDAVTARSLLELTKLEEQYNVTRIAQSGTANEIEIQHIKSWEAVTEASFHKAGIVAAEVYAQLHQDAQQALDGVGVDTDNLRAHSIASLEEIARNAQRTYEAATLYAGGMTREGIEHFRALRDAAVDAVHTTGAEHDAIFAHMRDDVDRTSVTFRTWLANVATDAEKAALSLNRVTAETDRAAAAAKHADDIKHGFVSGTFDMAGNAVTSLTSDRYTPAQYTAVAEQLHTTGAAILAMVTAGQGSLEEILAAGLNTMKRGAGQVAALAHWIAMGGTAPTAPAFAGGVTNFTGGAAWVGERGPELVTLPRGSNVLPFGRGGGGTTVSVQIAVNGVLDPRTVRELSQSVGAAVMRAASTSRQFGSA